MLAVVALALFVAIGPPAPVRADRPMPAVFGATAIPAEPGASVLFEGGVFQAVAADLDGDGSREIVALTDGEGSTIAAIAWRATDAGWRRIGEPLEAVSGSVGPDDVWRGWRVRLLVRAVGDEERITLVRQPDLRSADEDGECCLRLDDLALGSDGLRLVPVAPTRRAVEAVLVLDLDGDGIDELVATRSVLPLGDVSYPTDMFVHTWAGDRFSVLEQRLPIGSGDTPFVIGDTDGIPGEELAIMTTAGRPELHRIALGPDGTVGVDDAETVALAGVGVPLGDGRGVAVLHDSGTLSVHAWPVGEGRLGPPLGSVEEPEAVLLGVVDVEGMPRLVTTRIAADDRLRVFDLPDPAGPASRTVTATAAALTLREGPMHPYVGPLPGGLPGGHPAVIHAGRLIGLPSSPAAGIPFPALVGAQPVGLVGRSGEQLALLHGVSAPPISPIGGRLDPPAPPAGAAISVAPLTEAMRPEVDDARFDPPVSGGTPDAEDSTMLVGTEGLVATIEAPAGSRVYIGAGEAVEATMAVPEAGVLDVPLQLPATREPGSAARVGLTVTTPAGHSYVASWEVQVLDGPPSLAAAARTKFGSGEVDVAGHAPPYAAVTVGGRPVTLHPDGRFALRVALPPWPTDVEIVATDPVGNASTQIVSGIGWLDYRQLPWLLIVAAGIGLAGVVLFLRVPRPEPVIRRADDDAALEEMELD